MIGRNATRGLVPEPMLREPARLPVTRLGSSGLHVSRMALGSWRTYERMSRDDGLAVMRAAREAGITFLDDARYNDETGRAPIPSGYSEVVFGELFRASGWRRDDVVVSNKLWWEFWPEQTAAQELAGSLGRMGLDHIDLIYAEIPPANLPLDDVVAMVTGLIAAGHARAWGTLNWPPDLLARACSIAAGAGVPGPCATQLPYSLVTRGIVEDPSLTAVITDQDVAIVASYALAGGVLTGKYARDPDTGRAAGQLDQQRYAAGVAAGRDLAALAAELDRDPAQLAMAFVLLNPAVTTLLFGATRPEQVASNVQALLLAADLTAGERSRLAAIGSAGQLPAW
jgi:L-glyceraldehyde 3-phosphate reductase